MNDMFKLAWAQWAANAMPKEATMQQRMTLRMGFFSGGATMLGMILNAPEAEQGAIVAMLLAEMQEFMTTMEAQPHAVAPSITRPN